MFLRFYSSFGSAFVLYTYIYIILSNRKQQFLLAGLKSLADGAEQTLRLAIKYCKSTFTIFILILPMHT